MAKSKAASAGELEQRRSFDFPIVKPDDGGKNYLIKGIDPDVWKEFDAKTKRNGRSARWTLIALMRKFISKEGVEL